MASLRIAIVLALIAAGLRPAIASDDASQAAIRGALAEWTAAFNTRNADRICDLFEPGLIADIRTEPQQTYTLICDRLKRSLGDDTRSYHYSSDIKELLVFGDLAVVRLVWTLTIKDGEVPDAKSVETGMDIFRRQDDGNWKIMRYMAYSQ